MQVQSDVFLGWTAIADRDYLVRQLRDHKAGIENEDLEGNGLVQYGRVCDEIKNTRARATRAHFLDILATARVP
jgi:Uncharacterized protein conserved in bacteria (DUF2252)